MMDEQRLVELEVILAAMPKGLDECGVWIPWSEEVQRTVPTLIDEVRRLREKYDPYGWDR